MAQCVSSAPTAAPRGRRRRRLGVATTFQQRVEVRLSPRQQRYLATRRRVEAVLAAMGLAVSAVPMLAISLGVVATMGRPVLFTQERIGQDGRIFRLRKFRSMRLPASGAEHDGDRLVPFGRLLRETSLDELPSLWNIVVGDMSIVGPRPLTTDCLGRFSADQFTRHAVPAGLTGYAQVNGRNELGWDERFAMDQEYVRRFGPALDLWILAATVRTVLRRNGVTDAGGVSMSDFPGPQSTVAMVMEGPDEDGSWSCVDRDGRTVLQGEVRVHGDLARVEITELPTAGTAPHAEEEGGPGTSSPRAAEPTLLDEALLVLASRLRRAHEVEWAFLDVPDERSAALDSALERAGYAAPDSGLGFPTRALPPLDAQEPIPRFIAFLGLPEEMHDDTVPIDENRERQG